MELVEALDREIIIERAEEVRFWLLGQHLSSRATGAIQRELGAIIDNDPGTYLNGQRPLAGLTVADFIAELHRTNGGAVGRVKSVGYAALNELREKIPADTPATAPEPEPEPDYTVPELDAPVAAAPQAAELPAPVALIVAAEPAIAELSATVTPSARRGPGRPKGVTKAARNGLVAPVAPVLPPAPAEDRIAPVAHDDADPMLKQLARLWPALHPHARRAVVIYASALWAETATPEG